MNVRIGMLVATLALLPSGSGLEAQNPVDSLPTIGAAPPPAFPVLLGRDTLLLLRGALGPYLAEDRASVATARLRALVDTTRFTAADSAWAGTDRGLAAVYLGERVLFFVLEEDREPERTAEESAQLAADRLRETLRRELRFRSPLRLLAAIGFSLLATVVLAVFVRGVRIGTRAVRGVVLPAVRSRVPDLGVGGFTLLRTSQTARGVEWGIAAMRWIVLAAGAYLYLTFVFRQFPATRPWADQLGSATVGFIGDAARRTLGVIPDLAIVLAIVLVTRFVVRLANAFFEGVEHGTVEIEWLHPEVARPTRKLVAIGLWIFAVIVMFPYLPGSDTDAFKGVSIFVGLVLSLGSSGLVGNGMSGLVLMYSRALKVGDMICVGATTGEVVELGMLATRVRTPKNVVVTLPNSVVAGGEVRNFSRLAEVGELVLHTEVGVGYDTPWRTARQLLLDAARGAPGVLERPAPFVRQLRLDDFVVTYELNTYIGEPRDQPQIQSDLRAAILDVFHAAGIELLAPTFEVKRAEPQTTLVPPEENDRPGTDGAAPIP